MITVKGAVVGLDNEPIIVWYMTHQCRIVPLEIGRCMCQQLPAKDRLYLGIAGQTNYCEVIARYTATDSMKTERDWQHPGEPVDLLAEGGQLVLPMLRQMHLPEMPSWVEIKGALEAIGLKIEVLHPLDRVPVWLVDRRGLVSDQLTVTGVEWVRGKIKASLGLRSVSVFREEFGSEAYAAFRSLDEAQNFARRL